ncbi:MULTISPECIES: hypothetical protein [Paraburkholderia]|uniref:hypothetical protein n=1 Tax=Paraburkholderia TaxID=1822464 RepID=UPI00225949DC|nr:MULTISPECIES: hypothetical protein [Paraburkholderia]MCX4177691.1 hypothetical protein [Paraburkholderia madseniana]MDQ6465679.1 hypothetical protein [Paraburkholderia madseniana]
MSLAKFEVTAYEGQPGHSRFDRLHTIIGYVCGRLDATGIQKPLEELDATITKIHDHKGTLEVHWQSAEAAFKLGQLFIDAWTQIGWEPLLDFHLPDGTVVSLHVR